MEHAKEKAAWIAIDTVIIILTLAGNVLTICAIVLSKKLSELLSNRYIFSLAVSDLMVGLTIPYHLAFTIGKTMLPSYKTTCVLRFVFIILACSSSIYNLLAIAADRYIAIVLPFHYSRYMSKRIVYCIVFSGWCLSFTIATTPIYWNDWKSGCNCTLESVLPEKYINFIVTPMFLSIWLVMSLLYFRIWREAAEHAKRLSQATQSKQKNILKENKSVQMVLLILGCFSVCWLPYFVIITFMRFYVNFESYLLYEATFTMAVMNSCMNPVIYAWKNKNFRKAFGCMLRCRSPRTLNQEPNYITDHVPSGKTKRNSMTVICGDGIIVEDGTKTIEMQCGRKCDENSDATIVTTCVATNEM
ncbi:PREDICTED: D(2) dopamine receptor B [Nicrophorus vespilloides]|uniref:D(2) dopamine receptor B n=1 Tax=Nicrophorus vespilloides TaxID=110193 RepID=A0ABM1N4Y3_NICVS|nr:PREDICTED: D(2) dopamine receptor B [Nicrophorus vespilloides]